jgi:hypothetical protein
MKNQYFGDINDYVKYGLLRTLSGDADITTAICWMLTPDDDAKDGDSIHYLQEPESWRHYDPVLYDLLRESVCDKGIRDVRAADDPLILPWALFFAETLADDAEGRASYFATFTDFSAGCDLVFYDPDNGIEVKSVKYGRKDSSKYVYWREIVAAFQAGHSLLIYQHFPRVQRIEYTQALARELAERTGAREVYSFRTPRVLFLLAAQDRHNRFFRKATRKVADAWGEQIQCAFHIDEKEIR